jgi:multicomponent Na+:H+ antiporter subunit C
VNQFGSFIYWATIVIMVTGLYIVIARDNLIKKLVGLSLFQTAVYFLYIAPGKLQRNGANNRGRIQRLLESLPHVLILTAIVVGVATLALGLALVVRINESFGSIEEDDILAQDDAHP